MAREPHSNCDTCLAGRKLALKQLNIQLEKFNHVVALAGNPNTGKSTVFNALTGLRQHTGNWPGKTISRAEGGFSYKDQNYKIVDLPGTYSLHAQSADEEVARDFIISAKPDVTVVVCDATAMTRNLNLAIQIRQITGKVVIAVNLMDEALRSGIEIDFSILEQTMGVPVVPIIARRNHGIDKLLEAISAVASEKEPSPESMKMEWIHPSTQRLYKTIDQHLQQLPNSDQITDWHILRLLQGHTTDLEHLIPTEEIHKLESMIKETYHGHSLSIDDEITGAIFQKADEICAEAVREKHSVSYLKAKAWLDTILIGKWTGLPVMAIIFSIVLWLTITGANVPSGMLATLLIDNGYSWLKSLCSQLEIHPFIEGIFIDGMYLTVAWVISVMLPPMAIFFPLFTLLEDFGYLPRVAFNLDGLFKKSGAHGKQALTMAMGYGCNAAGVIAARIIESPRERLIAIITNNFALCNGRWPTQILVATLFIGALFPAHYSGMISTLAVGLIAFLGVALTFASSWILTKTVLKGEPSAFSLELPPYRPPNIIQTLYISLIDRTIFVLWRAIVFAAPAGMVIWLVSNIEIGSQPLALLIGSGLDPFASVFGLTGIILLAYLIAIPANEIVVPTILMLMVMQTGISIEGAAGAGVMFETDEVSALTKLLTAGGWTPLTAICLMIFSLCHNPCSTTIYTIYKETRSIKWTTVSTILPLVYGFVLCAIVAFGWNIFV